MYRITCVYGSTTIIVDSIEEAEVARHYALANHLPFKTLFQPLKRNPIQMVLALLEDSIDLNNLK